MPKTFAQYLTALAALAAGAILAAAQTAPTTAPASQPTAPPKPGPAAATLPAEIPKPAPGHKPTIFIIGDSTVKNGADNGATMGEWGWGHILHYYFDTTKVTIENDAVGGTSSRSFMETPSMWPRLLPKIQPGDYVLMQFGHNDNTKPPESDTLRYRSTVSGNGENTVVGPVDPQQGGGTEVIHSFGWYIRQFVIITRGKGATPIVCSLIPRDNWSAAGKVNRADNGYALWAKQAADQSGGLFLPLNKMVADEYDKLGRAKIVADYFPPGESTHTNWTGARLNAQLVAAGIKDLQDPLKNFLLENPTVPETADIQPNAGRGAGGRAGRGASPASPPATTPTPATTQATTAPVAN